MKLVSALCLALGLVLIAPTAQAADDPGTITAYDSVYSVAANGSVGVVETITVDFPDRRHGIWRTFEKNERGQAMPLPERETITVTRDGKDETKTIASTGRTMTLKIGDPDKTITGTHVYRIGYTVKDAVFDGDDEGEKFSEFFWWTVGHGWKLPILSSRLTVSLPAKATSATCGVGEEETESCDGEGSDTLTFKTGRLEPGTGVSVRADYSVSDEARPDDKLSDLVLSIMFALASFFSFMGGPGA